MYQAEETVVMDVKPFPIGQGFIGGDKWWDNVLDGNEQERLDSMLGAALMDEELSERLLNGVDATVLTAFGLSEPTFSLIRNIHAASLSEFAQRVIQILYPQDSPTDETASGPPEIDPEMESDHMRKLILVIDANTSAQDALADALHAQGHAAMCISTHEQALPLARAVIPDLVIIASASAMDKQIVELAHSIRTLSHIENTPIIIYADFQNESTLRAIRRISRAFVLARDAPMEQLLTKVNVMLGTVRADAHQP